MPLEYGTLQTPLSKVVPFDPQLDTRVNVPESVGRTVADVPNDEIVELVATSNVKSADVSELLNNDAPVNDSSLGR